MKEDEPAELEKKVLDIISGICGKPVSEISLDADLVSDLGIRGDDGDDLIQEIDKAFKIDWSLLNSGVIFGNEPPGSVGPFWLLYPSRLNGQTWGVEMYETQHATVRDLVGAAKSGKWQQQATILKSEGDRRKVYFAAMFSSTALMQYLVLFMLALYFFPKIWSWAATR